MFTRLLLSYYRLIAVDLSRQKELDADPKAIQQIEFVGQLKECRWYKCSLHTKYVCLNHFRKTERNEIKIFSRKCNSIIKDDKL